MKALRCCIETSTDNFLVSFLDLNEIIGYSMVPIKYFNSDNSHATNYKIRVLTKTLELPVYLENTFDSIESAIKFLNLSENQRG